MEIPLGGAEFHADRRTDMTKLTVAIRNFVSAPKKNRRKSSKQYERPENKNRRRTTNCNPTRYKCCLRSDDVLSRSGTT